MSPIPRASPASISTAARKGSTRTLIRSHRSRNYSYTTRYPGHGRFVLETILDDGKHTITGAGWIAGALPPWKATGERGTRGNAMRECKLEPTLPGEVRGTSALGTEETALRSWLVLSPAEDAEA